MIYDLKTKQPTPPLPKRVNDQRTEEEPHCNTDGDLYHTVSDVEDDGVEIRAGRNRHLCNGIVSTSSQNPISRPPNVHVDSSYIGG